MALPEDESEGRKANERCEEVCSWQRCCMTHDPTVDCDLEEITGDFVVFFVGHGREWRLLGFFAKSPMWRLRICLWSWKIFGWFAKRLSRLINCTLGSLEQLLINWSFIEVINGVGMSLRGRRVENYVLLEGNFVEASGINIKMFETSSSAELVISRSFVPVCNRIIWGGVRILFWT